MLPDLSVKKLKSIDSIAQDARAQIFGNSLDNINLESFLENMGIDVRYINSSEVDGYLRWDNEKGCPVIAVSVTGNANVRQRFTMAHELGHLILDWKWKLGTNQDNRDFIEKVSGMDFLNILSYRGSTYTSGEQQVDEFAGAFLIPESKLKEVISDFITKHNYNIDDYSQEAQLANQLAVEVSSFFNVSNATARLRLKNFFRKQNDAKE